MEEEEEEYRKPEGPNKRRERVSVACPAGVAGATWMGTVES